MGGCMSKSDSDLEVGQTTPTENAPVRRTSIRKSFRRASIKKNVRVKAIEATRSTVMAGTKVRYAYMTQRGFYPDDIAKANQDSLSVTHKFTSLHGDTLLGVYDGHGRHGDKCSQFVAKILPEMMADTITRSRKSIWEDKTEEEKDEILQIYTMNNDKNAEKDDGEDDDDDSDFDLENFKGDDSVPKSEDPTDQIIRDIKLSKDEIHEACTSAHVVCNLASHKSKGIDDSLSGTTSISVYFHEGDGSTIPNRMTISNVGDSRAVLGKTKVSTSSSMRNITDSSVGANGMPVALRAVPLSRDQTPYRRDERKRVKLCGARIASLDQVEGFEPNDDDSLSEESTGDVLNLGDEIDEYGDPPRVWAQDGDYPGTAFTRSIGDAIAEELGVFAEPEVLTRDISPQDKIIVLASDGVFEFLTNQSVIDICAKFQDPLEACRAVVAESYELWLQYENRTDDITIICIFLDGPNLPELEEAIDPQMLGASIRSMNGERPELAEIKEEPDVSAGQDIKMLHSLQKHKTPQMIKELKEDVIWVAPDILKKLKKVMRNRSREEKQAISDALKGSLLFQNLTPYHETLIYGGIESVTVQKGEYVIRQGDIADSFYIIDYGDFEVRISSADEYGEENPIGQVVHQYHGSRSENAHPTFGDLGLLRKSQRQASIVASTEGKLWKVPSYIYLELITSLNDRRVLLLHLCKMNAFGSCGAVVIEEFAHTAKEMHFQKGQKIIKEGDSADSIYFIARGECMSTGKNGGSVTYVGETFIGAQIPLREGAKYDKTVVASNAVKCLRLDAQDAMIISNSN